MATMQASTVARDVEELYDMLRDAGYRKSESTDISSVDPTKITDAERVALYEQIITGVLGKDYYDSLGLNK